VGSTWETPCVEVPAHLDVTLRQLDPRLATEQRQQHRHTLVRRLAGIEREMAGKRALLDAERVADVQAARLGQLDQPATLSARSSAMMRSGTRAGRTPSITRRITPGA
jgi:hypothetical protein